MRIGLAYDLKEAVRVEQAAEDALEEYDSQETVKLVEESLRESGHDTARLGGGTEFLRNILAEKVDFVFNIAEGRGAYRSRESQVPSVLEMLDIPYSGSDPQCLAICLDKPLAKKLAAAAGVRTPEWRVIDKEAGLQGISLDSFPYPAIVKPAYEGSSKGIRLNSVVEGPGEASEAAGRLLELYRQPVMLEEYIDGDEITVGVIGNAAADVLGIMHVIPRVKQGHFIYSLEVKRDYLDLVEYECPPHLDNALITELEALSLAAFRSLGCRDFARLDFRISQQGAPYFIEINPLPGLGSYSDLVIMAGKMGWSHSRLVGAVLDAALERYPQCVRA
ncbi:MAG: D-alanine--D-alanine ligase [Chloroflexi bacterium]|nr:D-alanine--D-alanine ligase [Chloroflexota bacterium]